MTNASFDASVRPTFNKSQIDAYLDLIALPKKYRSSAVFDDPSRARTIPHGLPLASALQRYQQAAIPFENLSLHYAAPYPSVNIGPEAVFSKAVMLKCGRGGRCMENNNLLYHVLLSLGFDVVAAGGRVNEAVQPMAAKKDWPGARYDGWNHRITLVKFMDEAAAGDSTTTPVGLSKRTFLVDAGFGSQAPTRPVELLRGPDYETGQVWLNVPPEQESRLIWTTIADAVDKDQKMWVYELKFGDGKDWMPSYCFTETEFLPRDYEMMSFFTSNNRKSWFTSHVVCVKMLLGKAPDVNGSDDTHPGQVSENKDADEGEEDVIIGDITLFDGMLKRRLRGKNEVLEQCETEAQRIAALRKYFGMELSEVEKEGIRNTPASLS